MSGTGMLGGVLTSGGTAALDRTLALAACSSLLLSLQLLVSPRLLGERGPVSWRFERLLHPGRTRVLRRVGLDAAFRYPAVLALVALQALAAALTLAMVAIGRPAVVPLAVLVALELLLHLRNGSATDAAGQFTRLLLTAGLLALAVGGPAAARLGLYFIAGQSALCYLTSGLLKITHRGWWNGRAMRHVLSSSSFGSRSLSRLVGRHGVLAVGAGIGVCTVEALLGVSALLPPPVCLTVLGLGVALHASIARLMGLNTYLFAFVSAYPAVWFVSTTLYRHGV